MGVEAEQLYGVLQRRHNVGLGHFQLQLVVADAVEIKQLAYKREHPVGIALDDAHQLAVAALDAFGLGQFGDGSGNHGQRRAEFVGHVGEVVHLDLVETLLLLFFLAGLLAFFPLPADVFGMFGLLPVDTAIQHPEPE